MLEYNKQDKNGNPIIVKITYDDYVNYTYVNCSIYETITVKRWFKTRQKLSLLHEKCLSLHVVNEWTCVDFELWTDGVIDEYNNKIKQTENNERVISLIKNGCK
jgi:hypothetical protein